MRPSNVQYLVPHQALGIKPYKLKTARSCARSWIDFTRAGELVDKRLGQILVAKERRNKI